MYRSVSAAAAAAALAALCCNLTPPADADEAWARFRGPNGAGVDRRLRLPNEWSEAAFHWSTELPGIGHGSPVVWGGRVYVLSGDAESGERTISCIAADDGRTVWNTSLRAEAHRRHKLNSLASCTPAVDERHVYFVVASPEALLIIAVNHAGEETWRRELPPHKSGHGFGGSPIVVDDLLIVPNEHEGESELLALDTASGRTRWRIDRPQSRLTYTVPCLFEHRDGRRELIFTNYEYGVTAVDPATGEENWSLDIFDKGHIKTAISSPVAAGELVLASAGWLAVRQQVIAVRPEMQEGRLVGREVWTIERGAPLCTTPLVVDDLVFLWADEGIVTCADVATGKTHWQRRVGGGTYYASPVCAGDGVYNISTGGEVVALAASKDYQLLGRSRLKEGTHSTPAIAGGKIFVRTFENLMAIDGRGD